MTWVTLKFIPCDGLAVPPQGLMTFIVFRIRTKHLRGALWPDLHAIRPEIGSAKKFLDV